MFHCHCLTSQTRLLCQLWANSFCLCRARNSPSHVTYKANDEVMMSARRQIAEQQQELERLRQETYVLKEAHQVGSPDLSLQQHVADLQKTVSTYKQLLETSQQHSKAPQQQVQSVQQQLEAVQQQHQRANQQLQTSQQQVQDLQQQLSSSQQQILSLSDLVSTLQQQAQAQTTQLTMPYAVSEQVVLVPVSCGSRRLLLDKSNGCAYAVKTHVLRHVGSWTEQLGVQLTQPTSSVAAGLEHLQAFAASQQHQLQQFFSTHAQDSTGSISVQLLPTLVSSLLPATSAHDLQFVQAMLALDNASTIALQDLLAALEASVIATDAAAAEAAIPQELRLLSAAVQQQQHQLCELFEAHAGSIAGSITVHQLITILRHLDEGTTNTQLRCLLAKLHAQGVPSHISLQDVHTALQLRPAPKVPSATHLRSSPNASPRIAAHTSSLSPELHAICKQLAQSTKAAQHHAQACSNKDAELVLLQRAVKQLQQELHVSRQQAAAANASNSVQRENEALEAQIRAAGDKAHVLKTRFLETKSGFQQLKTQHARVVKVTGQHLLASSPSVQLKRMKHHSLFGIS